MTDPTAPTIPGHECNAYCRPDEGLHCTLVHTWRSPREPNEDKIARILREVPGADEVFIDGVWRKPVDVKLAAEVPPLPEDQWVPYMLKAYGTELWDDHPGWPWNWPYSAAYLYWWRDLAMVPA